MADVVVENQVVDLVDMGKRAKNASVALAKATSAEKNAFLLALADALAANTDQIVAVNRQDIEDARVNGVSETYIRDRIELERRMPGIIADVRKVAELRDPVGEAFDEYTLENGLKVSKRRVPLGVLGVIYEARPQVTVDIASLALKTGNAVIMRGGREVLRSNMELVRILSETLANCGFPADAVQYINSTDRKYVGELLKLHQYVDMIIPRGGNGLHNFCRENSTIPVIIGGIGVCHIFVDESAKLDNALEIIHNAKTQRPAVCNSVETILVHSAVAEAFLPKVVDYLGNDGVVFKAEPRALSMLAGKDKVEPAEEGDFDQEWYALILSVKVVDSLDEALEHIRDHSTQHSDAILTEDMAHGERFLNEVDSAAVYLNASTRFTDGSALGLGAEVAISTQKLHARGPMALKELTTYKWIIIGEGQIRK